MAVISVISLCSAASQRSWSVVLRSMPAHRVRVSLDHDQALRDDGRDLRDEPIEEGKGKLARLLVDCQLALALNRVFDHQGVVIFEHACKLGRLRMLAAH